MARPTIKPTVNPTEPDKQKHRQLAISTNKRAKKNWAAFDFYYIFRQIWVIATLNISSRIARDCMWLSGNLYQDFYLTTF